MICTFGDTTDVTWWRELDLPVRSIIGRDGRLLPTAPTALREAPYAELAGKTVKQAQKRIVELLAESPATWSASRSRSPHPVKFYEKGDRPLEIVTSRQWYIRNGGRDAELREELLGPRQGAGLAPAAHAGPLRELGQRPQRRLADQPAALLRRADPALVPPRQRPASPCTTNRWCRRRTCCPIDPSSDVPAGLHRGPARPAGRLRRRRRRHGHLGDLVAHPADRRPLGGRPRPVRPVFPMDLRPAGPRRSSAPGCSPPWCAPTSSTACCPGATPPSTAGSSTRTARR